MEKNSNVEYVKRVLTEQKNKKLQRSRAIKAKCLDCCCYNAAEVMKCPCKDCPLWVFRKGSPSKVVSD